MGSLVVFVVGGDKSQRRRLRPRLLLLKVGMDLPARIGPSLYHRLSADQ